MLLTNTQISKLPKAFANNSLANIKLSKAQLHKMGQPGGFLDSLVVPLRMTALPLKGNLLKPLAKSVLMPLGLTAAVSATYVAIHKNVFGSGNTKLIISNEEMNDIMKIIKSFDESGFLIKDVNETIKNEAKEQERRFLRMLLGILGANLLRNLLTGKGTIRAGENI